MTAKKIIFLFLIIVLTLSGCYGSQTPPPGYPSDYDTKVADVEVQVNSFLFDFSDIVLENGSVTNTMDKTIGIHVMNHGDAKADDVEIGIQEMPSDLQVWSTIVYCDYNNVSYILYKEGKIDDCIIVSDLLPNTDETFFIRIKLTNASEWTYKDNELYTVLLKCSWEGRVEQHCSQGNTYYSWRGDEITIPLKVRT